MKCNAQIKSEFPRRVRAKPVRNFSSAGLALIVWISMLVSDVAATEFYVSPNGSSSGDGSLQQSWDLRTALLHPTNVVGGDIIWLRGGVYRRNNQPTLFESRLNGEPHNPIIVRQMPGERATIDGNISQTQGAWVTYWGFEIMNSHSNRLTTESGSFPKAFTIVNGTQTNDLCVSGFDLRAPNVKLINLVVHDSIGGGIGVNSQAHDPELYGVISYYNGWQGCDRGHGHGFYGQSRDPSFAFIQFSLFFANYALGIQATSSEGLVDNFIFYSNTLFSNGILSRNNRGNLLIGPVEGEANFPALVQNYFYDTNRSASDVNVGYLGGANFAILWENYFQTSVHLSDSNQNAYLFGNTFLATTDFDQANHPSNLYLTNRPEENFVRMHINFYEPNRTQIIVYNWEGLSNVMVDASWLIPEGTKYEVRSAQDYFGAPVLSGTYAGGDLALPMTNLRVAKPVGTNAPPSTAPEFNAFILSTRESPPVGGVPNTSPQISLISDQATGANTPTAQIPFTIFDAETPAECLTLSVCSSRPDLVPNPNLQFAGNGMNRTIKIVPEKDKSGTATITLAVSDGFLSASNVFTVTVNPVEPGGVSNPAVAPIGLKMQSDNTALLDISGASETRYEVQASTNLQGWNGIGTIIIDCTGIGLFQDREATNYPSRFYRARKLPSP